MKKSSDNKSLSIGGEKGLSGRGGLREAENMVLSDADIRRAVAAGELDIAPFEEGSLTPNGYDLSAESVLVPGTGARTDSGTAVVNPRSWFVLSTRERVRLGKGLAAQLWLRTTYARKGVLATFGKIDAGFDGTLTVTAFNASDAAVEVPVGGRFCQMVLERLDSPSDKGYAERSGRYQHQKGITLTANEAHGAGKDMKSDGQDAQVLEVSEMQLSVPNAGDQPCKRHGCDHCCHSTEMPLTFGDIKRIRALGFEEKYFIREVDGWFQLRNIAEGHCFFLYDGLCSIYPYRPQGCTYYPVVFDLDRGEIVLDTECPHRDEYHVPAGMHRQVSHLVDRLQRERRDRRRRRPR